MLTYSVLKKLQEGAVSPYSALTSLASSTTALLGDALIIMVLRLPASRFCTMVDDHIARL